MTENTFHLTQNDLRKPESRVTKMNDLKNPKSSNVSALKVKTGYVPLSGNLLISFNSLSSAKTRTKQGKLKSARPTCLYLSNLQLLATGTPATQETLMSVLEDWKAHYLARVIAPCGTLTQQQAVLGHLEKSYTRWQRQMIMLDGKVKMIWQVLQKMRGAGDWNRKFASMSSYSLLKWSKLVYQCLYDLDVIVFLALGLGFLWQSARAEST